MMTTDKKVTRDYDRLMLRAAYVSLLFSGLRFRKKRDKAFGLSALARAVGKDKATLSRDFNGSPNWRLDTIADIAGALNLELRVSALDRATGAVIGSAGEAEVCYTEFEPTITTTLVGGSGKITTMIEAATA